MTELFWHPQKTETDVNTALRLLTRYGYPVRENEGTVEMYFIKQPDPDLLSVRKSGNAYRIEYGRFSSLMRGIPFALTGLETKEPLPFDSFGIMLDCSRNKVFTIDFLKRYFLQLALFGCNCVMLYTEDTYVLPDEPFFGYMRGGYTPDELRELDDFCAMLGLELSACIQTLGHMEHPLQWEFAYGDIMETPNVLLAGYEKTYVLIEKMLCFWSQTLRSRKIHLGMDEAHDLGRGRNFDRCPGIQPQELFHRHLDKVNLLCRKYGFENPMIWSDMYFRLSNPTHKYYGCSTPLPESVGKRIPENVRLCYWDYYHETGEFYEKYIGFHRALGFEPVMVSGLWTWAKFWYDHQFTEKTVRPCLAVCRSRRVRNIFFAMWGDDGAYCCFSSALAGFCFAADLAAGFEDAESASLRFHAVTGKDYRLVLEMSALEQRVVDDPANLVIGDAGALLWDDPLLAINWRGLRKLKPEFPAELDELLGRLIQKLENTGRAWQDDSDFALLHSLMCFLRHKYRVRMQLEEQYVSNRREEIPKVLEEVSRLQMELQAFMDHFRTNWLQCAKRFGLEVHQKRNAGQLERLFELERCLMERMEGKISGIPEFEKSTGPAAVGYQRIHYRHLASGSFIK